MLRPSLALSLPTGVGPIVPTRYSRNGSLDNVLTRVRRNDAPSNRINAAKLRMIVSLISSLGYLHSKAIVHRALKPSDSIVQNSRRS
jgi:serine/threonine protein kinase